jgi:hypothetical protein
METPNRLLVPIPEAREQLGGIGHTTIYELFRARKLTLVKLGRRSFVTADSIAAYVNELRQAASA